MKEMTDHSTNQHLGNHIPHPINIFLGMQNWSCLPIIITEAKVPKRVRQRLQFFKLFKLK